MLKIGWFEGFKIFKVYRQFKSLASQDLTNVFSISPFGDDSVPTLNDKLLISETENLKYKVCLGVFNDKPLAEEGEKRLYSVDNEGNISFYAWLHNNGTMELGGTEHNLVRYLPLETSINKQNTDINTELAKIATVLNSIVPGSYTLTPISSDISESKINEIKTL